MAAVTCFRCRNGGYTTPPVRASVPELLDVPGNVVVVDVELCAGCRTRATRENTLAVTRSKGKKG